MLWQLVLLALLVMVGVSTLRVVRARSGRTPLPGGRAQVLLMVAILIVPPVAFNAFVEPSTTGAQPGLIGWLMVYALTVGVIVVLMRLAANVVKRFDHGPSRWTLLVALVGGEGDQGLVPFDPPLTAELAESLVLVNTTNAAFPRGPEFPEQINRPDFRTAWEGLDGATRILEGQIAGEREHGLEIASVATETALDARSRLNTLRGLALRRGLPDPA